MKGRLCCVELCAGAGGQAIGVEKGGFKHEAIVEINETCCETLQNNRPKWNVINSDIAKFKGRKYSGIDLLAGGLPCPPFSVAGRQLGADDKRDCFPQALRIIKEIIPKAVVIENVPGLLQPRFEPYRKRISSRLDKLGYSSEWYSIRSCDYGVAQYRPRTLLIALDKKIERKRLPQARPGAYTVGECIYDLMAANGWAKADKWRKRASVIAPTIVGGSERHGGPDLGPTRAREAWRRIGIDGRGIANEAPPENYRNMPRLTLEMVARIQGFPGEWEFAGGKTRKYRQIGNALPPPVAHSFSKHVREMLR